MFHKQYDSNDTIEKNVLRGLKLKRIKCPVCQEKSWEIIGDIENIYEFNHEEKQIQGNGYIILPIEFVKVLCKNCGHISEFNIEPLIKVAKDEQEEYSGWPIGLEGDENEALDDRQKRFVLEYIKDGNKEQAALRAGYENHQTAHAIGTKLMCSRKIIKAIKEQREKLLDEDI